LYFRQIPIHAELAHIRNPNISVFSTRVLRGIDGSTREYAEVLRIDQIGEYCGDWRTGSYRNTYDPVHGKRMGIATQPESYPSDRE